MLVIGVFHHLGNLSYYTREETIYGLFSNCGEIKLLKIGLNRKSKTPCGFCFVEYYTRDEALFAKEWINGSLYIPKLTLASMGGSSAAIGILGTPKRDNSEEASPEDK